MSAILTGFFLREIGKLIANRRPLIYIYNRVNLLNKVFFLLVLAFFPLFFFLFFEEASPRFVFPKKRKAAASITHDYEKIGQGPLSVCSEIQSFPFPDLSGRVLCLSQTSRPDACAKKKRFLLGLKGSKETVKIKPEKLIYLSYGEEYLRFSEEETPLWVRPKLHEGGESFLEMGIDLKSEGGNVLLSESREFPVLSQGRELKRGEVTDSSLTEGMKSLEEGKWWPPDRLFDQYAGEKYSRYRGLHRLEVAQAGVLFVQEGALFIWKEGRWQEGAKTEGYPLAQVREISPYKMKWQFWDESGLESTTLTFRLQRSPPLSIRLDEVMTRIRQRTTSRISCRLDNRATILKVGDWLLKTGEGWHIVKDYQEVDKILELKETGELFIFDGLESLGGKEFLCGTLFDSMRTASQPIRIPLAQTKKQESPSSKKRGSMAKIESAASARKVRKRLKPQSRDL